MIPSKIVREHVQVHCTFIRFNLWNKNCKKSLTRMLVIRHFYAIRTLRAAQPCVVLGSIILLTHYKLLSAVLGGNRRTPERDNSASRPGHKSSIGRIRREGHLRTEKSRYRFVTPFGCSVSSFSVPLLSDDILLCRIWLQESRTANGADRGRARLSRIESSIDILEEAHYHTIILIED